MKNIDSTGKAFTEKKFFSRETTVSTDIKANPNNIWDLLTDAAGFPKWNSTIISINGKIAEGGKIELKSVLDPKRVFKLKIKEFIPGKSLVWGDAMGTRSFTLTNKGNGITNFTMYEKIGGPLFPLFAKMIPPFDESFDKFASDLKKAAETKTK